MSDGEQAYNPTIVLCLRILARRGRLIREERERQAAEAMAPTPDTDGDLTFYDDKSLSEPAEGA